MQAQASNYTVAQATSYTGNQLHRQPVTQAMPADQPVTQATSYPGNQLHTQPVTWQAQAAQAQGSNYTVAQATSYTILS